MPLFRKSQPQDAPPAFVAPPPVLRGTLACSAPGCTNQDGVACAYVDRRGRACPTAWCPDHQIVAGGVVFCRRHARQHGAVPEGSFLADRGLPDLDNRAPSLVNWIGDALEPSFLALLSSMLRPGTSDEVGTEPVHHVRPPDGRTRWDRAWKIFDHTGILTKITVEVEESRDPEVDIRVGRKSIVTAIPPWIARRRRGERALEDAADEAERSAFYKDIYDAVVPAVMSEFNRAR
jgi:hypothetical protein